MIQHLISTIFSHMAPLGLFGLIVLLGLVGGSLVGKFRYFPVIFGYLAIGSLVGPHGLNIVDPSLMSNINLFSDISLGLILFDLGRQLDLKWLRHDRGLIFMALADALLTFILIFVLLVVLKLSWKSAILAAIIAMATSPAVVMMVANDLSAEGPVTRRVLMLTSLNNFFALTCFNFFVPLMESSTSSEATLIAHTFYRLFGSFLLGIISFLLVKFIAMLIKKQKESQFILFFCAVILAISLSRTLALSTMLTLFTMGVAARNLDVHHHLLEIDFGLIARLFLIVLFVTTGIHLDLSGLWQIPLLVLAFLSIRMIAKVVSISLFSKMSQLTWKQTTAMSFALIPMAGVAVSMSNTLADFNPDLGAELRLLVITAVTVLNIIGPFVTQFAFIKTGEANLEMARRN
jgi:Kef-type K+ transport system membrane component KefB